MANTFVINKHSRVDAASGWIHFVLRIFPLPIRIASGGVDAEEAWSFAQTVFTCCYVLRVVLIDVDKQSYRPNFVCYDSSSIN